MFRGLGSFITFIWYGFLLSILIVLILGGVVVFRKSSIKSDKPIKPKIELIIKDNKVDTVYVYEK